MGRDPMQTRLVAWSKHKILHRIAHSSSDACQIGSGLDNCFKLQLFALAAKGASSRGVRWPSKASRTMMVDGRGFFPRFQVVSVWEQEADVEDPSVLKTLVAHVCAQAGVCPSLAADRIPKGLVQSTCFSPRRTPLTTLQASWGEGGASWVNLNIEPNN